MKDEKALMELAHKMKELSDEVLQALGPDTSQDEVYDKSNPAEIIEPKHKPYEGNKTGAKDGSPEGDDSKSSKMAMLAAALRRKSGYAKD